jgi:hypothetical protein
MRDIIDAINESTWSPNTKKMRVSMLKFIKKDMNIDKNTWDFLKDVKLMENYIYKHNKLPSTRFSKIATIKNSLALVDKRAALKYDQLASKLSDEVVEYKDNNVVVPDKLLTFKEMMEIPYKIEDDIKYVYGGVYLNAKQLKELGNTTNINAYMRMLTDYVICVLYMFQTPVRSEFGIMYLKKNDNNNWYDNKTKEVHFNDFKNVKSFGKRTFKLDNEVGDILTNYLKVLNLTVKHPERLIYLWNKKGHQQFNRSSFCSYFRGITKKYTDKELSLNNFRHSYETALINDPKYQKLTFGQKRMIHERLLHRLGTAQEYVQIPNEDAVAIKAGTKTSEE